MDINTVASILEKVAKVKKISNNEYEIVTEAKINNKTPIKMYLYETEQGVAFGDKKHTLKFMNNLYELKSIDVINCISAVVKIYGFTIMAGELIANIAEEKNVLVTFYNFIICVGQLANMYVFFDKP